MFLKFSFPYTLYSQAHTFPLEISLNEIDNIPPSKVNKLNK